MRTTVFNPCMKTCVPIRAGVGLGAYDLSFFSVILGCQQEPSFLVLVHDVCKNEWVMIGHSVSEGRARESCSHRATYGSTFLCSAVQATSGCQEDNTCSENGPFLPSSTGCVVGNKQNLMPITHKSMKEKDGEELLPVVICVRTMTEYTFSIVGNFRSIHTMLCLPYSKVKYY